MKTLKKLGLIIKIGFRSIFGTTRGLQNVEEDIAFILDKEPKKKEKPGTDPKTN